MVIKLNVINVIKKIALHVKLKLKKKNIIFMNNYLIKIL